METSNSYNSFCNYVFECNLPQHVSEPAHVKGNVLDLILTSKVSVNNFKINPLTVIHSCDNFAISLDFSCHTLSSVESITGYDLEFL